MTIKSGEWWWFKSKSRVGKRSFENMANTWPVILTSCNETFLLFKKWKSDWEMEVILLWRDFSQNESEIQQKRYCKLAMYPRSQWQPSMGRLPSNKGNQQATSAKTIVNQCQPLPISYARKWPPGLCLQKIILNHHQLNCEKQIGQSQVTMHCQVQNWTVSPKLPSFPFTARTSDVGFILTQRQIRSARMFCCLRTFCKWWARSLQKRTRHVTRPNAGRQNDSDFGNTLGRIFVSSVAEAARVILPN